jgi:hypothetical protein
MSSINLKTLRQLIKEEFDRHNNIQKGNKNNPVGYNSDPYGHDNMAAREQPFMAGAVLAEEIPPTDMPTIDPAKAKANLSNQIASSQKKISYLKDQLLAAQRELEEYRKQASELPSL